MSLRGIGFSMFKKQRRPIWGKQCRQGSNSRMWLWWEMFKILLVCDSEAMSLRLSITTGPGSPQSLVSQRKRSDAGRVWLRCSYQEALRSPGCAETQRKKIFKCHRYYSHVFFPAVSVCSSLSHRDWHTFPLSLIKNRMHFSFQLSNHQTVCLGLSWSFSFHIPKPARGVVWVLLICLCT